MEKTVIHKNIGCTIKCTDKCTKEDNRNNLEHLKILEHQALLAAFELCKNPKVVFMPERIVKSDRATIVFWLDGTKTVVRRAEDEPDNDYNAFCASLAKKIMGSTNAVRKVIERKTEVKEYRHDKD